MKTKHIVVNSINSYQIFYGVCTKTVAEINRKGDSTLCLRINKLEIRVPPGAHYQEDRSKDEVERFLSSIHFEYVGKFDEFGAENDQRVMKIRHS